MPDRVADRGDDGSKNKNEKIKITISVNSQWHVRREFCALKRFTIPPPDFDAPKLIPYEILQTPTRTIIVALNRSS